MPRRDNSHRIDELLASVTEDMLDGDPQRFQDNSIHVERILLEMVRPDPVQPRRVLPEQLHRAFHDNRLTPSQALRELVQLAQVAARQQGRPFNGVLELLPDPDDEGEDDREARLSPEERFLRDLANLAVTIRDDGQVNPLTVVDVSQGVTRQFRIETGERRYWATWLLRDFIPGYDGDGMIPCIIIPTEQSSIFRQAKENTARSGLSAIALARQAALLLLTVHGYQIPDAAVPNDFYRQALDLDLRSKREYSEAILAAMGGIKKSYFGAIKALLRLSDEAIEIADRHNIEEGKLRYVSSLPDEYHGEILRQIIDFNLTSRQVKALCQGDTLETEANELREKLPAAALRIAKVSKSIHSMTPQDLARAIVEQEGDAAIARARLQAMYRLITEAEQLLSAE